MPPSPMRASTSYLPPMIFLSSLPGAGAMSVDGWRPPNSESSCTGCSLGRTARCEPVIGCARCEPVIGCARCEPDGESRGGAGCDGAGCACACCAR
jgi:hypothetical protein